MLDIAAPYVFAERDWLKMRGIDAKWLAAEVVERETFRDGADQELVGKPVRSHARLRIAPELPVAIAISTSHPEPTRAGLVDLRPEPLSTITSRARRQIERAVPLHPQAMFVAQPVDEMLVSAAGDRTQSHLVSVACVPVVITPRSPPAKL
jgi:hypothetical protein